MTSASVKQTVAADMRVGIVGGGVIGLSTALALADAGLEVHVFERGEAGMQSTWAGAGILYPLLPWDYDEGVNAWCSEGIAAYPAWCARLEADSGIDTGYRVCGMRIPGGASAAALRWLAASGQPHQTRDDELLLPAVAQVRNPWLIRALAATCRAAGVRLHQQRPVRALDARAGRVRGLLLETGAEAFDVVVLCAGAWAGSLAGLPGRGVWPVRGQMLALKAPAVSGPVVYRDGRYLVPRGDGVVLVGATLEEVGFDASTTAEAERDLRAWAGEVEPALRGLKVIRHWAGLRPASEGNRPFVGRHPQTEGLWLNVGHFRYGLTMAPACAARLALELTGAACASASAPPARLAHPLD